MHIRTIKTAIIAALSLATVPCLAQDELPLPAPVDTPMVNVDCCSFGSFLLPALTANPSSELYKTWVNYGISSIEGSVVPDNFEIDLRGYSMPTTNTVITDVFGYRPRRRRVHYGLDIDVETGDTIRAAFDGKVRIRAFQQKGYGHYVVLRHENGLETVYGHMSKVLVNEDQMIRAGDPIGLGGSTGRSTGSHLHFETRLVGTAINPALMFDFPHQKTTGESYTFAKKAATKAVQSSASYYKVRQGDTLSKIAQRNHTSIRTICKLNGISQNSIIRPGQRLRVR